MTIPISHTLCGDLIHTSTFMSVGIIGSSTPVSYSPSTLTHKVYSENPALIGTTQPYTVKAEFIQYPQIGSKTPDAKAFISFLDPCPNPESVSMSIQINPSHYYYTAQTPKMKFVSTHFVVYPPICSFTYSC